MIWQFLVENWHKILVVALTVLNVGKYIYEYISPSKTATLELPAKGCTITIKPL